MSSFGSVFRASTFGESHGGGVGVVIDGVPPCLPLTESDIQPQLTRRRPGAYASINTARNEADKVKILSGTGMGAPWAPHCLLGPQQRTTPARLQVRGRRGPVTECWRSQRTGRTYSVPATPTTYWEKYGTHSSYGGRSSARETIGRVIAGTVGEKFLSTAVPGFQISFVSRVGDFALTEERSMPTSRTRGLAARRWTDTVPRCQAGRGDADVRGGPEDQGRLGRWRGHVLSKLPSRARRASV